jgi:hypothetical protein
MRAPASFNTASHFWVLAAFDQVEGLEVAWNQVDLAGSSMLDEHARERLFAGVCCCCCCGFVACRG